MAAVLDDLRHSTGARRHHGPARRHRFNEREPEPLRPPDRKDEHVEQRQRHPDVGQRAGESRALPQPQRVHLLFQKRPARAVADHQEPEVGVPAQEQARRLQQEIESLDPARRQSADAANDRPALRQAVLGSEAGE